MFEPCPECGGSGIIEGATYDEPFVGKCPLCVGGYVIAETVIEEMARAILMRKPNLKEPSSVQTARAAARVVLEHMEDSK